MGKSVVRAIVIFAIVLVAVVGGIALTVPVLVSTETAQTAIERELSSFFGTPARLDGTTEIRFFPRPQATLGNVTIAGNVPGVPALLTADTITVDIRRGGSLLGQPTFARYRLVRPHLRLTQNAEGEIDWSFVRGQLGQMVRAMAPVEAVEGTAASRATPHEQDELGRLGQLSVENGRVTVTDTHGEVAEEFSSIDLTLNWPSFSAPVSLSGDTIWRGAEAAFQLRIAAPNQLSLGTGSPVSFDLQSKNGTLAFEGTSSLAQPFFSEGELAFDTPSMPALMEILRADVPSGRALGSVSLNGPVRLAQHRLRFEGATIDVDGNVGTGALEFLFSDGTRRPGITGTLDFPSLELGTFLAAFSEFFDPGQPGMRSGNQESQRPDSDLRLSAATASFGELELSALAATVQVSDNVAIFDVGDAIAYGGHIQARLTVDPTQPDRYREIMLSGQDVDTALIGAEFGLPELLPRGRGKFSLSVTGVSSGWRNLLSTADGYVTLEMIDGVLPGLGIETLFGRQDQARYFSLRTDTPGERFTRAVIDGDIKDGVVTVDDSKVTYPNGVLDLAGIVSLSGGSLALTATGMRGTAKEDGTVPGAEQSRYFIGGSWNRPFATPVLPPL